MYNRYIPNNTQYERIPDPSPSARVSGSQRPRKETQRPPPPPPSKGAFPPEGITGRLGGLLKQFHLEDLDSGDILLVLILLFLFLESDDNLELVITLALLLLFGLFSKKDEED